METNWDDLRVFLALAREGTLTTAARRWRQPSHRVAPRAGLGADDRRAPFERLPDRFVPTAAGEELLADTEAMEKAALSINRRSAGLSDNGERRGAPVGRRGDGGAGGAPPAVAARPPAADRVRGDRDPHRSPTCRGAKPIS